MQRQRFARRDEGADARVGEERQVHVVGHADRWDPGRHLRPSLTGPFDHLGHLHPEVVRDPHRDFEGEVGGPGR
ncbi:hypothetical protein GCM10009634_52890 [Saccharothrix xinjiangensis]